jgi:O-antigen/teichoic acid export membrane protein
MGFSLLKLLNSDLKKNILKLFSATIISQTTAILSSFVLAFYFLPGDLGEFSVVISISAILSIIFTLRTEYPIVINPGESNFSTFYSLFITIAVFAITALLTIPLFLFQELVFGINLNIFLTTLFVAISLSFIKILQSYLVSKSRFGIISISKVLQVFSILIIQITLFKLNIEKPLILGFLFGLLFNLFYLFYIFAKTAHFYNLKKLISCLGMYIYKFRKIVGIGSLSDIINSTASNMLPTLILVAFSKEIAGYYFFANRVLSMPLQLLSSSSASVYFQRASGNFKRKEFRSLKKLTLKLEYWNGLAMLFITLMIAFFLEDVLHVFFGDKWDMSLKYIYILLPFFLVRSLFSPISNIMEILDRNDLGLYLNSSIIILNFLAIRYGAFHQDILKTIMIISLAGCFGYLAVNLKFLHLINKLTDCENERVYKK